MPAELTGRQIRSQLEIVLLAVATVLVITAAAYLSWLLWRYVPPHAALFEALGVSLPSDTRIAVAASNWFVRLVPFLLLLAIVLTRLVLVPLAIRGVQKGERWAVSLVAGFLFLVTFAELGAAVFVLRSLRAGCANAAANPRYGEELSEVRAYGATPCSSALVR
jgi:type II secretory pathway component PulF